MLSHGNALVHPSDACQKAHDAIVAVELAAEDQQPSGYFGVFTDGREASGVYTDWAEVSSLLARAASYDEVAVWGQFDTRDEAMAFVSAETRAVASASAEARAEATRVEAVPLVKGVAVSWAPCKREGCQCSASFNGLPDEYAASRARVADRARATSIERRCSRQEVGVRSRE